MRCSEHTVLIVEDDDHKLKSIVDFLQSYPGKEISICTATSVTSALRELSSGDFCLAIIDMSLPTFDVAVDRFGGGRPQGFGGADILRYMVSETPNTFSVVITQYEEFPATSGSVRRDLAQLESDLRKRLSDRFLGVVHFSGHQGAWREKLASVLDAIGVGRE